MSASTFWMLVWLKYRKKMSLTVSSWKREEESTAFSDNRGLPWYYTQTRQMVVFLIKSQWCVLHFEWVLGPRMMMEHHLLGIWKTLVPWIMQISWWGLILPVGSYHHWPQQESPWPKEADGHELSKIQIFAPKLKLCHWQQTLSAISL